MPPPSTRLVEATVLAVNAVFVLLLVARFLASRARRRPSVPLPARGVVATQRVDGPRATLGLVAMGATSLLYYGGLVLWWVDSPWLGTPLVRDSWAMYGVGLGLSAASLVFMGWAYAVFASWRWRARIDPGHQLMTAGPFRVIRHPLYLSFGIFYLGAFFLLPFAWFLVHAGLSFFAYDFRARIEEGVMLQAFGGEYGGYQARTGRYLPRLRRPVAGRSHSPR